MAKSPAERKAAQRQRQRNAGLVTPQWQVEAEEHEMIKRNCALRSAGARTVRRIRIYSNDYTQR